MAESKKQGRVLALGGLAAILASTCCLGPLVLVSLGFSGAWIGKLSVLEPYRPAFIALTVVALLVSGRQIYRPVQECAPDDACAIPELKRRYKVVFWIVASLAITALVFPYVAPIFY